MSYHGNQKEATPLETPRGCTDCGCLVIFIVAWFGIGCLVANGSSGEDPGHFRCPMGRGDGNLARFGKLPDHNGKTCGEDGRGDYLYFCSSSKGVPDLGNHVCVDACPTSDATQTAVACGSSVQDYPTFDFAGLFCMPSEPQNMKAVKELLSDSKFMEYLIKFTEAARAWEPLAISAVTAVILGFIYLWLLETFAVCLMWIGIIVLILVPGGLGGYLAYSSQNGGIDGIPSSGDAQYDLMIGAGLGAVSFVFACIACCKGHSINTAAHCISEACHCIFDVKMLLVEPFLALVLRILIFIPLLVGALLLLSCGNVTDSIDLTKQTFFDFDSMEKVLLAYYFFMVIWVMELCTAVSQFVGAYTVELWYFADKKKTSEKHAVLGGAHATCGIFNGYFIAISHHLGTLCFGSLIISLVRVVRIVMEVLVTAAKDTGNPIGAVLARCCSCCVDCFERFLEFVNKNAYMDVAMNSTNFCHAAKHALEVLTHEAAEVAALNGATGILQVAGLGAIAACGALLTWVLTRQWPKFANMDSDNYVQDPLYLCGLSAVISFVVALPFLHMIDIVSDTILYCIASEEIRKPDEDEGGGSCGFFRALTCSAKKTKDKAKVVAPSSPTASRGDEKKEERWSLLGGG